MRVQNDVRGRADVIRNSPVCWSAPNYAPSLVVDKAIDGETRSRDIAVPPPDIG